ncbi:MAG: hypothetical protein CVV49_09855 [Spirochaetae bacterium HGW-Spirochaetae-5]|nr:MAG: hypothetical protein CVV49_09855 [Spirochaetae bacterium HGW-Spirochaetae-5]
MKIKHILLILIITISSSLSAESDEDRFFYKADADSDLKLIKPDRSFSKNGIQYGAIISPIYLYEENDDGKLGSYIINTSVWAKVNLWKNSFFYIRGKDSYMGINTNEGKYSSVESDNLLDLDLAYLSSTHAGGAFNFALGRKYYSIGSGVVLNGRGDGGEASIFGSIFSLKLLGLHTGLLKKDNNPYGLSDKDITDGAERAFSGGTVTANLYNQKIYFFGLAQIDMADQTKDAETKYDSQYYGAGLEGVVLGDVSYFAEFIYETGTSYITNSAIPNEESDIAAMAVNSGINYYIPVAFNPALILQYSYGSGDKNRKSYTTSNRSKGTGEDDTGFMYFGTFSGGYALKPVLSNIHIFRAGFSFAPIKKMSLGAKYNYYKKDKKEGTINSGEAELPEAFIGQGIDVSLRWQMFYDLSMYVNYGLFLPGDAYESSTGERTFVMAGINLSI